MGRNTSAERQDIYVRTGFVYLSVIRATDSVGRTTIRVSDGIVFDRSFLCVSANPSIAQLMLNTSYLSTAVNEEDNLVLAYPKQLALLWEAMMDPLNTPDALQLTCTVVTPQISEAGEVGGDEPIINATIVPDINVPVVPLSHYDWRIRRLAQRNESGSDDETSESSISASKILSDFEPLTEQLVSEFSACCSAYSEHNPSLRSEYDWSWRPAALDLMLLGGISTLPWRWMTVVAAIPTSGGTGGDPQYIPYLKVWKPENADAVSIPLGGSLSLNDLRSSFIRVASGEVTLAITETSITMIALPELFALRQQIAVLLYASPVLGGNLNSSLHQVLRGELPLTALPESSSPAALSQLLLDSGVSSEIMMTHPGGGYEIKNVDPPRVFSVDVRGAVPQLSDHTSIAFNAVDTKGMMLCLSGSVNRDSTQSRFAAVATMEPNITKITYKEQFLWSAGEEQYGASISCSAQRVFVSSPTVHKLWVYDASEINTGFQWSSEESYQIVDTATFGFGRHIASSFDGSFVMIASPEDKREESDAERGSVSVYWIPPRRGKTDGTQGLSWSKSTNSIPNEPIRVCKLWGTAGDAKFGSSIAMQSANADIESAKDSRNTGVYLATALSRFGTSVVIRINSTHLPHAARDMEELFAQPFTTVGMYLPWKLCNHHHNHS